MDYEPGDNTTQATPTAGHGDEVGRELAGQTLSLHSDGPDTTTFADVMSRDEAFMRRPTAQEEYRDTHRKAIEMYPPMLPMYCAVNNPNLSFPSHRQTHRIKSSPLRCLPPGSYLL